MPQPLQVPLVQCVLYYVNDIFTLRRVVRVSKRIRRAIVTMDATPRIACSSVAAPVREWYVSLVLALFPAAQTLCVSQADSIVNFSRWAVQEIEPEAMGPDGYREFPLTSLTTYAAPIDELLSHRDVFKTLHIRRLAVFPPKGSVQDVSLDAVRELPSLRKLVVFVDDRPYFPVQQLADLARRGIHVIIHHRALSALQCDWPSEVVHCYDYTPPAGVFSVPYLVDHPVCPAASLASRWDWTSFARAYFPCKYKGEAIPALGTLTSLQRATITACESDLMQLPTSLTSLRVSVPSRALRPIAGLEDLTLLTRLRLRENGRDFILPPRLRVLTIDKLQVIEHLAGVPRPLETLNVFKLNGKRLDENCEVRVLSVPELSSDAPLPHGVEELILGTCTQVVKSKRLRKLVVEFGDQFNISLMPRSVCVLHLYNVRTVDLSKCVSVTELFLGVLVDGSGRTQIQKCVLPPAVRGVTVQISGTIVGPSIEEEVERVRVYCQLQGVAECHVTAV